MRREPWEHSTCASVHISSVRNPLHWACSAGWEAFPRNLMVFSRRWLLPHARVNVDFSEQSLWALIIHAGGVSCPRGQLFWTTVLFTHLAPRKGLNDNSSNAWVAAAQVCSPWNNSPPSPPGPLPNPRPASLILLSRAEMKNRLNVSF